MYTYMCITKSFYVPKTQYCKSTIRQLKKKKKECLSICWLWIRRKSGQKSSSQGKIGRLLEWWVAKSYRNSVSVCYCGTQVLDKMEYSVSIYWLPDKLPRLDKITVRATMKDMESLMSWLQKQHRSLISIWQNSLGELETSRITGSLDLAEYCLKHMGHSSGNQKYIYFYEIS